MEIYIILCLIAIIIGLIGAIIWKYQDIKALNDLEDE